MRELVPAWNPLIAVELVSPYRVVVVLINEVEYDVAVVADVIVFVKVWPAPLEHVEGQY
jgi:hypothetical protein